MAIMILVVGGAGYIGSHMVKELISHGREVVILDNLTTGHRESVLDGEFIKGDLGDENLLHRIFKTYPIHTVMHFAAFSLVGESVQFPLKYFENNVAKTITLLKVMLEHGIKCFIFSSSAAVYGEPEEIPISENSPVRPTNPYGASKLMVEDILQKCDKAHGLRYISLRYFNAAGADETGTMGENHNPESHLIPLVLKAAKGEKKNITVFGTDYPTKDGTCIRDYIHVTDLSQAHLLAMDALENGESSNIYNLGNSHGCSVKEVIETAVQVTGRQIPVVEGPRRLGDPAILVAGSEKIKKELGWQPKFHDLKTILKTAWQWHSNSH